MRDYYSCGLAAPVICVYTPCHLTSVQPRAHTADYVILLLAAKTTKELCGGFSLAAIIMYCTATKLQHDHVYELIGEGLGWVFPSMAAFAKLKTKLNFLSS